MWQKDNKKIALLVLATGMVALSGCAPEYKMQPQFIEPLSISGQECVKQCFDTKQYCDQRSAAGLAGCKEAAHHRAMVEYKNYNIQYDDNSAKSNKTVDDFYDDSQCHQSVPCGNVYNQCFVHCGGSIQQKKVCVKNCKDDESSS
jgi:hypothetical protein